MTKTFVMYTAFDYKSGKVTGGTRRFLEIVYGLIDKGNKVHLFIPNDTELRHHPNLIRHDIKNKNSKILPNGLLNFVANRQLLKSIKKIKYDSFIIISVPYAIQCVLLNLKKLKFIIWEDFIGYKEIQLNESRLPKFIKRYIIYVLTRIERKVLANVDKVIVQCDYDKQITLNRHLRIGKKIESKFEILFNNVNPSWIEEKSNLIQETPKRNINIKQFVFIGNIDDKRKGLHLLINAFKLLSEKHSNCRLKVIGSGKLLDKYIQDNKEYDIIDFIGYTSNPLPLLIESDMLIVPSLADSFPNTVMEALFFEVPVIGSKVGGIPEMLEYQELLFDPTVDSLCQKMDNILKNDTFDKMKELTLKRKKELTFDWVAELEKLI